MLRSKAISFTLKNQKVKLVIANDITKQMQHITY
jgi:hypothetical protein